MEKRGLIILTLIISTILITSCGNNVPAGDKPLDTLAARKIVQSGIQGIEIQLQPNYPPATIYDQNELIAIVDIMNKGNQDVEPYDCFVQISGFDPNIIRGFDQTRSCSENRGILEGKSVYNVEGGLNQIEFKSSRIGLPQGVPEYSPTLNIVSCYNYHTTATPSICVDPLFYQITPEQKICEPQDVLMGGGQGAPVSITYVKTEMIGDRAIFEINVRNSGSGRVLSPNADIRNCGGMSLDYTDLDRVGYRVDFVGGTITDCKPRDRTVRLTNGQGKIICTASIPPTAAFETLLKIDLDYAYIQSITKSITIVKTPSTWE